MDELLPPTLGGWREYLSLAPTSGLRWTELNDVAEYWWGRGIPRDLLVVKGEA